MWPNFTCLLAKYISIYGYKKNIYIICHPFVRRRCIDYHILKQTLRQKNILKQTMTIGTNIYMFLAISYDFIAELR